MNITINGNVTINNSTLTLDEAKTLAEQGTLTLRQLRSVLPSTKDVKTPSRDWVREHMEGDQVFFSKEYANGDCLVVFQNGFYRYGDENWTVLRVDGFSKIYYEIDEDGGLENIGEDDFLDGRFVPALGMNALWQLNRNAVQRRSNTNETSVETVEGNVDESTPDIVDLLIEREEKDEEHRKLMSAIKLLTPTQQEVVIMRYWKKMTIRQIAVQIGRSEDSVKERLKWALRTLRKRF